MTVNSSNLMDKFSGGVVNGAASALGSYVVSKAIPPAVETAKKVDAYLTSFPIEKHEKESGSGKAISMSIPEMIVLHGGIGAFVFGFVATPVLVGTTLTATAMKVRREYVNNECTIM